MKALLRTIIAAGFVACALFCKGNNFTGPDEKGPEVIVKCDSTATACVLLVLEEANVLYEQGGDLISRVGLSPADLISVTVENDVKNKLPELWKAVPAIYRNKLKGALIIDHRGEVDLDD